jgi:hypothetical protein
MIRTAMRTFEIVYIDSLLRLLYANHPNVDKPKVELMIPLGVMGWIHLVLVLVYLNIHEI